MYKPDPNFVDIQQAYPVSEKDEFDDFYFENGDYNRLLWSMNLYPLVFVEEDDYQGESLVLLRNDDYDYGILNFSWGSCSGCDALKSCDSSQEVDDVRHQIYNKIHWGENQRGSNSESIINWWLERDIDILEFVSESVKDKFNKMIKIFMNTSNYDEDVKVQAREMIYQKLVNETDIDELKELLKENDFYSCYKLDDNFVKEVLF